MTEMSTMAEMLRNAVPHDGFLRLALPVPDKQYPLKYSGPVPP
jgi:hypothetical protein